MISTTSVIGLPVARTTYQGAVGWIKEHALKNDAAYAVEAANTQVAAMNRTDAAFHAAMAEFDLITPDGMPLVWALNHGQPVENQLRDRVYGPTLMLETFAATENQPEFRHFLLGGKQSTLDKLESVFAERFPGTSISGSYSPPFGTWPKDTNPHIFNLIRESRANLIWVGLGCPKQERWIAENKPKLPPGVYFGIGAAFAFHAGEISQAPPLLQRNGLEWAYRLAMEPRRLFKRYFTYNSLFIYHFLRDRMKK
ncbi:MAG: WecB/TagA/CpsF family glycosyltransferase [Luteolibacter sp.]